MLLTQARPQQCRQTLLKLARLGPMASFGGGGGQAGAGGDGAGGGTTFVFGKHKGRTFKEVMDKERGYSEWALKQESPGGMLKDFCSFLQSSGFKSGGGGGGGCSGGQFPASPFRGDAGGQPSASVYRPPTPSSGGARPPAPSSGAGGAVLGSEMCIVCEAVDRDRFRVYVEQVSTP